MRDTMPKIIIVLLMALIVGVPILLRPDGEEQAVAADAPRLVIYTPHNEQICYEIERAYNQYRLANGLPTLVFDWRTPGGTSDIRKSILSQYQAILDDGDSLDKGIGVDLFFGGGDYDHGKIAAGLSTENPDGTSTDHRIVADPGLPDELMQVVFPSPVIGGEPLYDTRTFEEGGQSVEVLAWTGVTLSSFGIVYNNDSLAQLGLDPPHTWGDLTDPRLRGWVALADPGHSGSISTTFNTILKREGWTEGWQTLRMAFANARYFATSADRVPVDVSRGDAAMGMCIDFYGRFQAGAIGDDRVGYVDPIEHGHSMTATTADPITLLRGAPTPELAKDFIAWLLSPEAQSLWQRAKTDTPDGLVRPDRFELRRQPIRSDLYTREGERATWVDQELDPFPTAVPFPQGTPNYFSLVAPVTKAMGIDLHGELSQAWDTLIRAREQGDPNYAQMYELFFAMPDELTLTWPDTELENNWRQIHYDPAHPRHEEVVATLKAFADQLGTLSDRDNPELIEANRIRWRAFFQSNYHQIIELGGA